MTLERRVEIVAIKSDDESDLDSSGCPKDKFQLDSASDTEDIINPGWLDLIHALIHSDSSGPGKLVSSSSSNCQCKSEAASKYIGADVNRAALND